MPLGAGVVSSRPEGTWEAHRGGYCSLSCAGLEDGDEPGRHGNKDGIGLLDDLRRMRHLRVSNACRPEGGVPGGAEQSLHPAPFRACPTPGACLHAAHSVAALASTANGDKDPVRRCSHRRQIRPGARNAALPSAAISGSNHRSSVRRRALATRMMTGSISHGRGTWQGPTSGRRAWRSPIP